MGVASAGVLFRTDRIYREFRQWLLSVNGEIIELPERTFRESGTDVNSVLVVVRDPSDELVLKKIRNGVCDVISPSESIRASR